MLKYLSLAVTVCAAVGFGLGLFKFFRHRRALFTRMIIFGIGCAMLGRLFVTLALFLNGEVPSGFNVGILGIVGSFLFFFASNFGQMDSLVDDRTPRFRKYRLIALIAPAVIIALYVVYYSYVGFGENAIVHGVEAATIAATSYFHLKHLIIPDVEYGVIRCLRMYNLMALIYAVFCMAEMIVGTAPFDEIYTLIVYVVLCIILLLFVPLLDMGVRRWTT